MALRIEDYGLIGDCQSGALVGNDGSIDWLCLPRFDSPACFSALLGTPEHGRWLLAPAAKPSRVHRRYWPDSLILETTFETAEGTVALVDFMPVRTKAPDLVRIVVGKAGKVRMNMEFVIRCDYGKVIPWVRQEEGGVFAIAGPEMYHLWADVPLRGEDFTTVADFEISAGQAVAFVMTWHPSHLPAPPRIDPHVALKETEEFWRGWSSQCTYQGRWRDAVLRSLITLKALTYEPTGGVVAALTTSLPELLGGVRNWDYRYCWLRDSTFTLAALVQCGYIEEARAWREWLLRAIAGSGTQLQIMYGVAGERRLPEFELPWLPGYEQSKPVRIGNGAYDQFQLDVFGEVMDTAHLARIMGLRIDSNAWRIERELLDRLETVWPEPDEGIWEIRGPRRHFTHSKVMAWVAFDRAIRDLEQFGLEGPVERWRAQRDALHAEICDQGYSKRLKSFVQYYGGEELDASLLMIGEVGFLKPDDPRLASTVAAIEKHLVKDGLVERYCTESEVDGLPGGEGAFLLCTFWLADNYSLLGRDEEATELFERLLSLRNDVGLLAEEYDTRLKRQLGNFPQAFSHLGLVNTARNLTQHIKPLHLRADGKRLATAKKKRRA